MTTSYRVGNIVCPACGGVLSGAAPIHNFGPAPDPGDFSLCIYCGTFLVFTELMTLRLPTADESLAINGNAELIRLRMAWRATTVRAMSDTPEPIEPDEPETPEEPEGD